MWKIILTVPKVCLKYKKCLKTWVKRWEVISFHLYMEYKQQKKKRKRKEKNWTQNTLVAGRVGRVAKTGEGGQKVQISSYKINPGDAL